MDRKSILGFVLIFIIIITLPFYYRLISHQTQSESDTTIATKSLATSKLANPITPSPEPEATAPNSSWGEPVATDIVVESELFKITLSTKGGGAVKRVLLKKYSKTIGNDSALVELAPASAGYPLLIKYIDIKGDSIRLDHNFTFSALGRPTKNAYVLNSADSLTLIFTLSDRSRTLAKRSLTFYGNSYLVDQQIDLSGLRSQMAADQFDLTWEGGLAYTETLIKDDMLYSKAHAYSGGEVEGLDVKAGKTSQSRFPGATNWTALRTKYFTVAFLPTQPALGYSLTGATKPLSSRDFQKVFNMYLTLPASQAVTTRIYFGPLDYKTLKSLNVDLENIMNFGFSLIRPISKFFLWSFIELHRLIPNYGWVLIIFSILIKILLTPLTNISTRSMKEMQKIQPQIIALREKYPNDPQKINAETMRLYREHGVNPMGGCLPILLQLPILWALFIIFRTTIELRQAAFIFWIRDLSAPDTIFTLPFSIPLYGNQVNVFPVLMVISQIIQQKISGATTNQQQKLTMWMMTIFFFFLFNQFPSGLNLYYTLFNVLAILQQKYFPPKPKPQKPRKNTKEILRQLQQRSRRRY